MNDPIRLSVGQIYDQYARSTLDKQDQFVDALSYDAIAISLNIRRTQHDATYAQLKVALTCIKQLEAAYDELHTICSRLQSENRGLKGLFPKERVDALRRSGSETVIHHVAGCSLFSDGVCTCGAT